MTRDQRTRRGRGVRADRMFVARRAVFSLVVFGVLLLVSVAAVLAGIDRHPDRAGVGNCPSVSAGNPPCAPAHTAAVPADSRR